jgi:hypothetical protein
MSRVVFAPGTASVFFLALRWLAVSEVLHGVKTIIKTQAYPQN